MELLFFLFGLAAGSFVSCFVYRINKENNLKGFLKGRSYCPKCKKQLLWFDNIPLLSFLLLKGKCRFCHSPIGWNYPLVELATGLLSLIIYRFAITNQISNFQFPISNLIYNLLIAYALVAIFISDLQYRTIPDQITYPAMFVTFIWLIIYGQWSMILAGLVAAGFFFLLVLLTRFKGMGLGDVKLAGLMGLFLGFPGIITALYLAFLTGATVGVILILIGKKKLKSEIPFGPFLVLATFITWFLGEKIWHLFV
ncbi:MAG: prepilin peptidase [Candidatus Shapirobacteria bacterium]|nr:prepilin peptidase [Candidatus Shapirobacteria bacterium]